MKIQFKFILPVIIAAFLFTACSNDDDAIDTEKPIITLMEPHDEEEVAPGEELHFEAIFTDNAELASYKIAIHNNFDGHTHGINKGSDESNPWNFEQVFQIPSGTKSFEAVHHLDVPELINGMPISEGHYHLGVFVTDTSGNESKVFLEIHIEDDHDNDHDH